MPDIDTLDPASLDRFRQDLVEAGFERQPDGRTWRGPISPTFAGITIAATMDIVIRDGWPYVHPWLLVEGIEPGLHLQGAHVCLWFTWDSGLAWLRLAGIEQRIEEWVAQYTAGAQVADPGMDPHLYFNPLVTPPGPLALLDMNALEMADGAAGDLWAKRARGVIRIGATGPIGVRWYARQSVTAPAHNWAAFRSALTDRQRRDLDERLNKVGRPRHLGIAILVWSTFAGPNALAIELTRGGDTVVKRALEIARTDTQTLLLRAGPDAAALQGTSVLVFGAGAVGSHVVDLVARSGVAQIGLADDQILRPGDLVRHVAMTDAVGESKPEAVRHRLQHSAPWTRVDCRGSAWAPNDIRGAMTGHDLIIDATGEGSFTEQVSRIAEETAKLFVSVALYRHGALARVRVQMPDGAQPIYLRTTESGYQDISMIPDEPATEAWETGCGAPVNNAPPISVALAAAEAAQAAVEALMGRLNSDQDIVRVLAPQPDAGFDHSGIVRFG